MLELQLLPPQLGQGCQVKGVSVCQELFQVAVDFLKLEKTVLGGVRGNFLGAWVLRISEEICEATKAFADCKYDPLDPDEEVRSCWGGNEMDVGMEVLTLAK